MERPKVRFSQTFEDGNDVKDSEAKYNRNFGKVKIKSIVPTNYPIKVLKNGKCVVIKNHKSLTREDNLACDTDITKNVSNSVPSIHISENSKTPKESDSTSNILTNNQKPIDQPKVSDCIDELHSMKITDEIKKPNLSHNEEKKKTIPCTTCNDSDENSDIEIIQVLTHSSKVKDMKNNSKQIKCNTKINSNKKRSENIETLNTCDQHTFHKNINKSNTLQKENKGKNLNRNQSDLPVQSTLAVLNDATNLTGNNAKTLVKKNSSKKLRKLQVMPCAKHKVNSVLNQKYHKKLTKNQVKKSTVFHVSAKFPNVSVQPGMSYKHKSTHSPVSDNFDHTPKDILAKPIYNSSFFAMKKIKDMEKEKLIADVEHLSPAYKNFINGKTSAALDFGPYETVYKDLIDLSIEDDKLPPTLMRSKDPEPRDKDFVPELSDFYKPKCTEQNFVIPNLIILNPVNVNTLSAFTMSNKICTWKN